MRSPQSPSTTCLRRCAVLAAGGALTLLTIAGCGSTQPAVNGSSPAAPSTTAPVSVPAGSVQPTLGAESESGASATGGPAATGARPPCELVTAELLATTLGTDTGKGLFEPTTAAGTGCRFTKVSATRSVNILVETTPDAATYLSELAYTAGAGDASVPGADRGYITVPVTGTNTSNILLVKGKVGVLVTIFQDSPPLVLANEQKLAAAILAKL